MRKVGIVILTLVLIAPILVLGRAGYVKLKVKGLESEAKLMLSHLTTLQKAYYIENNQYQSFEEFYGAQVKGGDQCRQPPGAAALGFLLKWCHQESKVPLRFAYRVLSQGSDFSGEAVAGSDIRGGSFVCFGYDDESIWTIGTNGQLTQKKQCHSYF